MPRGPLIPETPLQFSADLAAAVGLEEAVLLQQLKTVHMHQPATQRDGLAWLHVSHAYLLNLLPFWDLRTLLRVCDSLEQVGLLRRDRKHAARDCLLVAIDDGAGARPAEAPARPAQAPLPRAPAREREAREQAAHEKATREAGTGAGAARGKGRPALASGQGEPLPRDFTPSEDMLELLERFHGVPRAFALAQLEDFTLYWRERGSAGHAWQNRYKQHVQWHWKRHQQELAGHGHGGEQGSGGPRRTRDSSLEQDLTDTTWAD